MEHFQREQHVHRACGEDEPDTLGSSSGQEWGVV